MSNRHIVKYGLTVLSQITTSMVIVLIHIYRYTLSPDHGMLRVFFPGGVCRYSPTCSQYALDSIRTFGVVRGGVFSLRRVLRCHPFAQGGYDPVRPDENHKGCNTAHSVSIITQ